MTPRRSWLTRLFRRIPGSPLELRPRCRPVVETLEDRLSPATFTVINTADTGAGSLRNAVDAANGNISEASKRLGISRNTIYRKLRWNQGG